MPSVDGAMTRCPSTDDVAPERSMSAWSMWLPPGHHGVDQGQHLAPRRRAADPTRQAHRGVDRGARDRGERPTSPPSNRPALATRFGSSKVTPIRSIPRDTGLTESASWCWGTATSNTAIFQAGRHFPRMRGLYCATSSVDRGLASGGGADHRGWRSVVPELCESDAERALWAPHGASLAERCRVVVFDQRGTGESVQVPPADSARLLGSDLATRVWFRADNPLLRRGTFDGWNGGITCCN